MSERENAIEAIQAFLHERCGKNSKDKLTCNSSTLPLLQVACMGNPEKTIQGELFYFLRTKGINCLLEAGVKSNAGEIPEKRSIDILIYDKNNEPLIALELKHFSENQNGVSKLHNNMKKDSDNRVSNLDLIQIGFYTSVEKISINKNKNKNFSLDDFKYYRFISTYVLRKKLTLLDGVEPGRKNISIRYIDRQNENVQLTYQECPLHGGAQQSFQHKQYQVNGKVQFVLAKSRK